MGYGCGMSTSPQAATMTTEMTKTMVTDYLKAHPQFLTDHPELLETLIPPEQNHGRGVVDFQFYAIDNLRNGLRKVKDRFHRLVTSAQDNLSVQHQVHKAVLAIMQARNMEQLLEVLTTDIVTWFDVDVVRLAMESDMAGLYDTYYAEHNYSGICFVPSGITQAAMMHDEVRLISDTQTEPPIGFEMIFADCSSLVRSAALLRLQVQSTGRSAMLAFGVRRTDHFHPHQGSELLVFLAQAMSLTLDRCLQHEGDIA
jgi:uncharacterized protein